MVVTTNNNKPISTNDAEYTEPTASLNSLAIKLAIVFDGLKILVGSFGELPIKTVTAIVSPNARPNDKRNPAEIPDMLAGKITFIITSVRVQPNA